MLLNIALYLRVRYIAKQAALSTPSYSSYGANGYLQQPLADDRADRDYSLDGSYHGALPRVFTDLPTSVEEVRHLRVYPYIYSILCHHAALILVPAMHSKRYRVRNSLLLQCK
jgi:hypothetical protein